MFSNNPDYAASHVRDRTPSADSLERSRHRHHPAAKDGLALRATISQYVVTIYHALLRT